MADVVEVLLRAKADFSEVSGSINTLKKDFQNLSIPKNLSNNLEKSFDKLSPLLKDYQKQLDKGFKSKKDVANFEAIRSELGRVIGEVKNDIGQINSQPIRLKADLKEITTLEKRVDALSAKLEKTLSDISVKKGSNITSGIEQIISSTQKASSIKPMALKAQDFFNTNDFAEYNKTIEKMRSTILSFSNLKGAKVDLAQSLGIKDVSKHTEEANKKINSFFDKLLVSGASVAEIDRLKRSLSDTNTELGQLKTDSLTRGAAEGQRLASVLDSIQQEANESGDALAKAGGNAVAMADELGQLQTSTQYFFSLRNMINLFRRGVQEAVETVKDLDAAMAETAVVTNYSVSDMWGKLPEYTANAKALGSTIQDMYEATTLYYQQGLNDEQAMGIASETMKMARIGGLEAADATDKMTAALRGFNMEINEVSAQRINDVYSNLAAKTASNTEELGNAMQRTASIAANAGMSFEGTAAFLAQAIETTREPAENIGTAMKTIIARMQEMKKNPLEISEVDGEEVDYNKIDAALRSVGISLKAANGAFRDNDEVLLDIAQHWDSMSQTQQRYIATTIAGSRQQSRFIAMVGDYDRTMELMSYANDSAGASAEQFSKLEESLEFKINKLKDTWQEFLMNIANEKAIKGVAGIGTILLDIINKVIEGVSSLTGPFEGISKSVLSLGTAFIGLRTLGKGTNGLIRGLGGILDPKSSFKEGFSQGFFNTRKDLQAAAISNPIVKAIQGLIPHIDNRVTNNSNQPYKFQDFGNYTNARRQIKDLVDKQTFTLGNKKKWTASSGGSYAPQDLLNIIDNNKLNETQQKALFNSSLGIKTNLTKGLVELFESAGESPAVARGLVKGFTKGSSTLESTLKSSRKLNETFGEAYQNIYNRWSSGELTGSERNSLYDQLKKQAGVGSVDAFKEGGSHTGKKVHQKEIEAFMETPRELSKWDKAAESVGKVSSAFNSAGIACAQLGAQISQTNPAIGQMITSFGNLLVTVGSIGNAITSTMGLIAANPVIAAVGAVVAAIGIAFVAHQAHLKEIKRAADEVVDSYRKVKDEIENNISALRKYQSQADVWAEGVDKFGNNISLSDEEYQSYLEAVDKIAELNPSIVQGYNAQGHAIVDINEALRETISLQEQKQKNALKEYTSEQSLQKLLRARNTDKAFKDGSVSNLSATTPHTHHTGGMRGIGTSADKKIQVGSKADTESNPVVQQAQRIIEKYQDEKWWNEDFFKDFNINLSELNNLDDGAVQQFIALQEQISNAAQATGKLSENGSKAFETLQTKTEAFNKAIQPTTQNLLAYAGNLGAYTNIDSAEGRDIIAQGIQSIAGQEGLTASEMQGQTRLLVGEIETLIGKGSEYQDIMKRVTDAQNEYASSTQTEGEYLNAVGDEISQLDSLMSTYKNSTSAYGQAIYEFLSKQKTAVEQFATSGAEILSQGINGMSSEIAAAEEAYTNFQEATKTDMSTGADNMKSIYDDIFKETDGVALHAQGKGDNTFWKGAEELLGRDFVEENGDNIDKVKNQLKSIEPFLKEGQEGFDNFWQAFMQIDPEKEGLADFLTIDPEKGTYNIDRNVEPEAYEKIAKAMGISEQLLVSMLNKGRQFADIDFTNVEEVQRALATDESVIKGTDKDGGRAYYVTEDYLNNALTEAGIENPSEQKTWKETHGKDIGVVEIANPEDLTQETGQDLAQRMGITDLTSLVSTLMTAGVTDKDTLDQYADKMLGDKYNPEELDDTYQNVLDRQQDPTLPPLESIESTVSRIAAMMDKDRVESGGITKDDVQKTQDLAATIRGKGGVYDTPLQKFALGQDANGNPLTETKYNETKNQIETIRDQAKEDLKSYQTGLKAAQESGDEEAEANAQAAIDNLNQIIKDTDTILEQGGQKLDEIKIRDSITSDANEIVSDKNISNEQYGSDFSSLISNLNINDLITDEAKQQALSSIKNAIKEGVLPTEEDLNTLGIKEEYVGMGGQIAEEAKQGLKEGAEATTTSTETTPETSQSGEGIKKSLAQLKEKLTEGWQAFSEADKTAMAADVTPGADSVVQSAKKVGQKLKEWWDAINNVNANNPSTPSSKPSAPTQPTQPTQPTSSPPAQPTETTTVIHADAKEVDEAKTKVDNLTTTAQQGATYTIDVPGAQRLATAAANAKKLSDNAGEKTIGVKTGKVETSSLNIKPKTVTVPTKADNKAQTAINSIKAKPVTVKISPVFTGTWTKTATVNVKTNPHTGGMIAPGGGIIYRARGGLASNPMFKREGTDTIPAMLTPGEYVENREAVQYFGVDFMRKINHKDLRGALQSFGSAAKGREGRLGPNGKGGLTLTGETGFEVAWIPSENRSVILGANGPQMANLPSDAIVWNHKQSKKIVGQKSISAGSMDQGSYKPVSPTPSTSSSSSYTKKIVSNAKKAGDKVSKTAEDTSKAVARVLVWWDNAARRAESIQRRMDKNQKAYENYIKDMRATLKTTGTEGKGNAFITNAAAYISEQERQLNRATTELTALNTGKAAKSQKGRQKQYNKGANNIVQISYEAGKGKKKKTKNSFINTAGYIYYDKKSQSYQVDQKALNRIKNKDQRQATAEAVKKELDDRISKRNAAQDNIQKAQEALDKFAEEMYNTFFSWENELTKIWNLTQKIEQIQARISGNDAFDELLQKRLSTGMTSAEDVKDIDLENFRRKLNSQNELLKNRQELITESKKEVANLLNSEDEKTTLSSVNSKLDADAIKDAKASELKEAQKAATKKEKAEKAKSKAQTRLNKVNSRIKTLEKKNKLSKKEKAELKKLKAERTSLKKTISNNNKIIKDNKTLANQVKARQAAYDAVKNNASLSETQEAAYQEYQKKLQEQIEVENKARSFTNITKRADGTLDIQFDTEAFERERLNGNITDEAAKAIQEWVKNLEEANSNLTENYENYTKDITEYYNQLEKLQDDWADYGKELTQISEEAEKQKIDKLKKLYDGIKKALDDLLTEVKRKLDERRQQEDNAKTEQDISQKQQRLAMLRADTAGGNQVEIAQLEKEIAEAQQNYQRSLEDQLINKLEEQNDLAAKQRERQIELQEEISEATNNIEKVNRWMANPELYEDEIRKQYYANAKYDEVTAAEQKNIANDFEKFYNGLLTNQTKQEELSKSIDELTSELEEIERYLILQNQTLATAKDDGYTAKQAQELFNASLQELRTEGNYDFDDFKASEYSNDEIRQAGFSASEFKTRDIPYLEAKSANYTLDELEKAGYTEATAEKAAAAAAAATVKTTTTATKTTTPKTTSNKQTKYNDYINYLKSVKKIKPANVKSSHINSLFTKGAAAGYGKASVLLHLVSGTGGSDPFTWKNIFRAIIDASGINRYNLVKTFGSNGTLPDAVKTLKSNPNTISEIKKHKSYKSASVLKYKTGGIADFTGPAWLDGTPSKPELVLNAQDTKNFIALKDVLSRAIGATSDLGGNYGDMTYEININVEKLTSDYDVDKVADRVKKIIVKDASYRNVTQVRKFR